MAKHNSTPEFRSAKAKFPYSRQLKVRSSYYYRAYNPRYRYMPHKIPKKAPVPWINIKGYWLNQAGFTIDTPLSVTVRKGRIVLQPAKASQ